MFEPFRCHRHRASELNVERCSSKRQARNHVRDRRQTFDRSWIRDRKGLPRTHSIGALALSRHTQILKRTYTNGDHWEFEKPVNHLRSDWLPFLKYPPPRGCDHSLSHFWIHPNNISSSVICFRTQVSYFILRTCTKWTQAMSKVFDGGENNSVQNLLADMLDKIGQTHFSG